MFRYLQSLQPLQSLQSLQSAPPFPSLPHPPSCPPPNMPRRRLVKGLLSRCPAAVPPATAPAGFQLAGSLEEFARDAHSSRT